MTVAVCMCLMFVYVSNVLFDVYKCDVLCVLMFVVYLCSFVWVLYVL